MRKQLRAAFERVRVKTSDDVALEEQVARLVHEHPLIAKIREQVAEWSDPTRSEVKRDQPHSSPIERAEESVFVEAASTLGVRSSAIPDFVARAKREFSSTESPVDPTRTCTIEEWTSTLRQRAGHLFDHGRMD